MIAIGLALCLLSGALLTWPLGCTTTLQEPENLQDPVAVHLLDHGHTASLVVPASDNTLRRYAYGDWRYYAQWRGGLGNGLRALFWPTDGALGRARLQGPATIDNIRRQVPVPIEQIYTVHVDRQAAHDLVADLDGLFQRNQHTFLFNPQVRMSFVKHPQTYSYFYNSNHMIAAWLESMGVRVAGPAYVSRWRVEPADP